MDSYMANNILKQEIVVKLRLWRKRVTQTRNDNGLWGSLDEA